MNWQKGNFQLYYAKGVYWDLKPFVFIPFCCIHFVVVVVVVVNKEALYLKPNLMINGA